MSKVAGILFSRSTRLFIVAALLLASFAIVGGSASAKGQGPVGAAYSLTNAVAGNSVAVFDRAPNGNLTQAYTVLTGGTGTGAGLASQGALALSDNGRWLFAVNAGSNDISVFDTGSYSTDGATDTDTPTTNNTDNHNRRLHLVDRIASGGMHPVSLTSSDNILYVLNAGVPNNISGFRVRFDGNLSQISNSTQPLSGADTGPAEVKFNNNGRVLVVTEKGTNKIDTYMVNNNGRAGAPNVQSSAGVTPYGFAFDNRNDIVVSEAAGGAANASSASSYNVSNGGNLTTVSASMPTYQTAACWVAISNDGRYAYTANTGSGNITGYSIGHNGSLTLLNANGITGTIGAGTVPTDIAVSADGRYLYDLASGAHALAAFQIGHNGSLTPVSTTTGLTPGSVGLVVR